MGNHAAGIAMLLLSLTGGMFLLAKTKKDGLSMFFTVVSWFVIVASLLAILCCGVRCMAMCGHRMGCGQGHEMMMGGEKGCRMDEGQCHEKMCMKRRMMHEGMECRMQEGCCMGMDNNACPDNGMNGCMDGKDKKVCVKDSVVIKK